MLNTHRNHQGLSCWTRRVIYSVYLSLLVFSLGCGDHSSLSGANSIKGVNTTTQEETSAKADVWREVVSAFDETNVSVAQLTLGEVNGQAIDRFTLFDAQFGEVQTVLNGSLKADSKRGLMGTMSAKRLSRRGEQGTLREDIYRVDGELEPLKLIADGSRATSLFPFKVKSGAEIKYVRLFESDQAATRAPLLTPRDLPFTLEKALALPEGCVVEIPIEAQVSLNFNGQLLSKAWGRSNEIARLLSTSSTGFVSGSVQGAFIAEGSMQLVITRLEEDLLRVRVAQNSEIKRTLSGNLNAGGNLHVKVIPSALVERVKHLKGRLTRWGLRPGQALRTTHDRIGTLKRGLPAVLQGLTEMDEAHHLPLWMSEAIDNAEQVEDPALHILENTQVGIANAEAWISEQIDQRIGVVNQALDPIFDQTQKYSQRAFNLNASISLSAEESSQLGLMGDYLLNLSTPHGQFVFESLLSGRARWEGLQDLNTSGLSLIDLTVADQLAENGEEGVRRLERASLNGRSQNHQVTIRSPLTQWSFERGQDVRHLEIERNGYVEYWEAEVWRVDRGLEVGPIREQEQLSLGVTLPLNSSEGSGWREGVLWFTWHKHWPTYETAPVTRTLSEMLNLTGRLGIQLGVTSVFHADAPGALNARFTFTLDGEFLDALFNQVSAELLWEVTASIATHFDNRFGLPYLNAVWRPQLTPEADAHCDVIAHHWGSQYCWFLLEEVIEPLLEMRTTPLNREDRLSRQRAWIGKLSQKQLLLNPIGARLFTRLLAELAYSLGLESSGKLKISLEHPTHAESTLIHQFESAELDLDDEPIMSFEVAEWLGISESLSFSE